MAASWVVAGIHEVQINVTYVVDDDCDSGGLRLHESTELESSEKPACTLCVMAVTTIALCINLSLTH